jgi:hypothetical protein
MPELSRLTNADAVRKALSEYERLGKDAFLALPGYRPARDYILEHNGRPT